MISYRFCAVTDPGRIRNNNEDNFYIDGLFRRDVRQGTLFESGICNKDTLIAAVCDGMGGEERGEEASLLATQTIASYAGKLDRCRTGQECIQELQNCADEANKKVCAQIQNRTNRMGTTMCMMMFSEETAIAMNLGDSRIYQLHKDKLEQISMDHSVVGRMVREGQLTEEEAREHPRRHQITQYLGIFPDEMIINPYIIDAVMVSPKDRFLLCSDGLTDMVSDAEIEAVLRTELDTDRAAECLKQKAIEAGGKDNITIVLVDTVESAEGFRESTAALESTVLKPGFANKPEDSVEKPSECVDSAKPEATVNFEKKTDSAANQKTSVKTGNIRRIGLIGCGIVILVILLAVFIKKIAIKPETREPESREDIPEIVILDTQVETEEETITEKETS